ncbi:hypothetical protein [Spirosoma pulveris]
MKMQIYDLNTTLDFGRHKGLSIDNVLRKDYTYLSWGVKTVEWFVLAENIIPLYKNKIRENIIDELFWEINDVETIILKVRNSKSLKEFIKDFENRRLKQFDLDCQKKLSLYNANSKIIYNKTELWSHYDEPNKISNRSKHDFLRDVLGGDPQAIWNID